jgi:iron complex outermembrane recepter protein
MKNPLYRSSFRRVGVVFSLSSLFLFGFIAPTHAQVSELDADSTKPLKELSLEQLGNLEVTTTSKSPEEVWKTPAAIYVITSEDIERSGATTIAQALRLAPGVEVARIDGDKWSVGIRGFGSRLCRSVLVLIDGRTVYTTLLAGTYWEVQDTLLADIERIEVIRGPGATIWGPNAVNGVINIITRSSKDTHGVLASAGGGDVEQGFANLRYGKGNGNGFDYRAYGKGYNRGPEFHPGGGNLFDDWQGAQAGFRMDWQKDSQNNFMLEGDIYDQSFGESVQATSYTPPYSQILDADAHLDGGNINGRWIRTQGEGKDIQVQVYYDRNVRREPNFGDIRSSFDVDYLQRFPLPGRQQISVGLGMRLTPATDIEIFSGLTFQPNQRTDQLYTAFFQDEIGLVNNRLSLTLGSKLVKTNFSPVQLEPSARLLWTPRETQTFWAAFTHAVRTPADVERDFFLSGFIGPGPGGLPFFARFNANRNFRSEQLNGYELGYRQLLTKTLYIDIAGFYNHYSDLFSEDITGGPFLENIPAPTHILLPAEFGNGLLGTTKGVEIAPEWRPTHFWRLRASYSYLQMDIKKSQNSLDVGSAPGINGSSPKHEVMVQSGFDISKSFTLDLDYRYISALPGQMVAAYSTAGANFGWRFAEHFRLSVVGQNLLQPHHAEFNGEPGPIVQIKRSAYGQITWQK